MSHGPHETKDTSQESLGNLTKHPIVALMKSQWPSRLRKTPVEIVWEPFTLADWKMQTEKNHVNRLASTIHANRVNHIQTEYAD